MRIYTVTVGPFAMNCYIVGGKNNQKCFIIDPGDEPHTIISTIEEHNLEPVKIICTHPHIDHAGKAGDIQRHFNIPFLMGEEDTPLLDSLTKQGEYFGINVSSQPEISGFLKDGDTIELSGQKFEILHTPGHSPGSICLYTSGHVFVGDVLFQQSIGRTDLFGGNYTQLLKSIKEKLPDMP